MCILERIKVLKVVENEKLRRNGLIGPSQQCLDLQGSHLGKRGIYISGIIYLFINLL